MIGLALFFYTSIAAVSNTFPPKTFALRNGKKSIFCSAICIYKMMLSERTQCHYDLHYH